MNANEIGEDKAMDGRETADLLPFYAAGTLGADDRARVEAALTADPALRTELALVREEQMATIESSEALGVPSRQAAQRLFAMLDAAPAPKEAARFDVASWIGSRLEALRPRTLAFASMAACLLVVAQASFIGFKMMPQLGAPGSSGTAPASPGGYTTASHEPAGTITGTIVVVAFAPSATAADIGKLLDASKASIVAGPLAGGLYQVRIADKLLATTERDAILARLKANSTVVRFAAPVSSEPE